MNIAVIGGGNLGGGLAKQFAQSGHRVFLGVRNPEDPKNATLLSETVTAHTVAEASKQAEIIVMAINPESVRGVAKEIGNVSEKIIIDAMNSIWQDLSPYKTSAEAFADLTNCKDVVKCFNTLGANNYYQVLSFKDQKPDMFVCGDSEKAKAVAIQLSKEMGFEEVYDLGGADQFALIEQLALVWITLSSTYGRDMAFKILKK